MQPGTGAIDPQPAGMGEASRLTGVFFEPSKAFADIAKRPRFVPPLIIILLVTIVLMSIYTQRGGWRVMIEQNMATSSRTAPTTPEARQAAIDIGVKYASLSAYFAPILIPLTFLIIAGVLTGICAGILSAPVRFAQVFSIVCYSQLAGAIRGLLVLAVLLMKPITEFDLKNPLMFNPGYFMNPLTSSKFLYSLASSLDLFTLWILLLTAIGLKAAGGKNLSFGGAFFAVALPWFVYVLVAAAVTGMLS